MDAGMVRDTSDPSVERVLGPLGAAVLRVLWASGEATVGGVLEALNADRRRPLAYTTVMTVLVRLHERGLVTRTRHGRAYLYRAASPEPALLEAMSARAVDALLARYGSTALRQFAERLADADPDLRARLVELAVRRAT